MTPVVRDVLRMAAGVGVVLALVALVLRSGLVDRLPAGTGSWQKDLIILAVWTAVCGLLMAAGRLAPPEAPRNLRAEQQQAWQQFQHLYSGSDEDAVAALSAPLAAIAWGDRARAYQAVPIAGYLAGNEAETHLFGLDRLAFCCRADGSVPIDPAERLAAAEALALRGATRGGFDAFPAAALALVRLAQGRHDGAAELLRPHLDGGDPQIHALFAVALLHRDPDAALRTARAAWEDLTEDGRLAPAAHTVRHALAHVERRVSTAQDRP